LNADKADPADLHGSENQFLLNTAFSARSVRSALKGFLKNMTALDKLKLITAWEDDPALTEDELEDMLASAALPDDDGKTPESEGWSPTYDINAAARDAWLIKAARTAALVEIDPPESGIVTSKVFDNCRRMARLYADRRSATVTISN